MAKTKIFTVLAMLFASSVALADNSVYIEQAGSSNTVSITQVGSTNKVGGSGLNQQSKINIVIRGNQTQFISLYPVYNLLTLYSLHHSLYDGLGVSTLPGNTVLQSLGL